jgi:hypothetical protein
MNTVLVTGCQREAVPSGSPVFGLTSHRSWLSEKERRGERGKWIADHKTVPRRSTPG